MSRALNYCRLHNGATDGEPTIVTNAREKGMTTTFRAFAVCLIVAVLQLFSSISHGGGADETEKYANLPPIPDVEEIIQRCEQVREKLIEEDHSTEGMRYAAYKESMCLRGEVLENLVVLLSEDKRVEVLADLKTIYRSQTNLYWMLFNDVIPCYWDRASQVEYRMGCGTQYHSMHNYLMVGAYTDLLRLVIEQRETHDW